MNTVTLITTSAFGLEKMVRIELEALGFQQIKISDGKIEFEASPEDIPRLNLWLRCADRVLLKMGEFKAMSFEELFEGTKSLPWENWITEDGEFTVLGKAIKSTLGSVRACQSIVKKAIVERLKGKYHTDWFKETGAKFTVQISMLRDIALLTIDTSGAGLHKRAYRNQVVEAPLKETLAAGLVSLSFWDRERILIDPMCGSGTILIEAAMIARNIAPGLQREFASERWPAIDANVWKNARLAAQEAQKPEGRLQIFGYDIDDKCIQACRINARNANVAKDIVFEQKSVKDLWINEPYGIVISNPPYGIRIADFQEMNEIYITLNKTFRKKEGWSVYILTADEVFPNYFKRSQPDRVRKLYNGRIKVNYYQYFGERPPERAG